MSGEAREMTADELLSALAIVRDYPRLAVERAVAAERRLMASVTIASGRSRLTADDLIEALAAEYNCHDANASMVANLCDDHLDRTGLLLGQVRERAYEHRTKP